MVLHTRFSRFLRRMTFLLQSQRNLCLLLVSNLQVFSDCANHCITEPHCLWTKVLNLIPHSDSFFSVPHWNSLALHVTKMINRLPDMVFFVVWGLKAFCTAGHIHTLIYTNFTRLFLKVSDLSQTILYLWWGQFGIQGLWHAEWTSQGLKMSVGFGY